MKPPAHPFLGLRAACLPILAAGFLTGCRPTSEPVFPSPSQAPQAVSEKEAPPQDNCTDQACVSGTTPRESGNSKVPPTTHSSHPAPTLKEECGLALTPDQTAALAPGMARAEIREWTPRLEISAQIYRGAGEPDLRHSRERHGFAYATAILPVETTDTLAPATTAEFQDASTEGSPLPGQLFQKEDPASGWHRGEREVLWEIQDAKETFRVGDMVRGRVMLPSPLRKLLGVPAESVLLTATGPIVYLRQGDTWLRRTIQTGSTEGGWTEVQAGLHPGDEVAARSVDALYLLQRKQEGGTSDSCH